MATIAKTAANVRPVYYGDIKSYRAGEALARGDTVAFDTDLQDERVYQCNAGDASRANFIGIVTDKATAAGQMVAVLRAGTISGFTFTPATEATHRHGNKVWTGGAGLVVDLPVAGSVEIGTIVPAADGEDYAITFNSYSNVPRGPQVTVSADADPGVTDDIAAGYLPGDTWINQTDAGYFILIDNAAGAADWDEVTTT